MVKLFDRNSGCEYNPQTSETHEFNAKLYCDVCGDEITEHCMVQDYGTARKVFCSHKCLAKHIAEHKELMKELQTETDFDKCTFNETAYADIYNKYAKQGADGVLRMIEEMHDFVFNVMEIEGYDKEEFCDSVILNVSDLSELSCDKCKAVLDSYYCWDDVKYCQYCLEKEFIVQKDRVFSDLQKYLESLPTVNEHTMSVFTTMTEAINNNAPDAVKNFMKCFWDSLLDMYDLYEYEVGDDEFDGDFFEDDDGFFYIEEE